MRAGRGGSVTGNGTKIRALSSLNRASANGPWRHRRLAGKRGRWGSSLRRDIFWINGNGSPHLAIVPRPHGDELLEDEMKRLRQGGIDTVVSLLEPDEADLLGLAHEEAACAEAGLHFLSYPIPDRNVPADLAAFRAFIDGLARRIAEGEHVGVHCRGCIGRSSIVSACVLMHLGWRAQAALIAITHARGLPVPDTEEQERWILDYEVVA